MTYEIFWFLWGGWVCAVGGCAVGGCAVGGIWVKSRDLLPIIHNKCTQYQRIRYTTAMRSRIVNGLRRHTATTTATPLQYINTTATTTEEVVRSVADCHHHHHHHQQRQ